MDFPPEDSIPPPIIEEGEEVVVEDEEPSMFGWKSYLALILFLSSGILLEL
jgi:hypothetical protein